MKDDQTQTVATSRSGAVALIEALEALDVRRIYGVPGEETTDLISAIAASQIEFFLCRHEQAAAFQASVHGRLTGQPGVCLSTLGPGATNLVTGVADAQLDHVPLIAITGQGGRHRLGQVSHQMIDLEALFRPITKLSRTIVDAKAIPSSVAEAFRMARDEKPGAVHLCIPEDVAGTQTDAPIVTLPPADLGRPSGAAVKAACALIASAERPVIVAGAGVIRAGAAEAVERLAQATNIPVATSFMAKGVLPRGHPQNLFTLGQPEPDYIDLAFGASDLVILIGFDPVEYPATAFTKGGRTPVLAVDALAAPADAGWQQAGHVGGDLTRATAAILAGLKDVTKPDVPAFIATRDAMQTSMARRWTKADQGPIAPQDICAAVSKRLQPDDTVLSGVGLHKLWVARHVQASAPGQVIIPNGLAGMGLALPGALAAATIKTKGRVLAICGDGDVLMNVQEMETAARHNARLTVMVWDDHGYGLIEEHQESEHVDVSFGNPDWGRLARAFGWSYARVKGVSDLSETLDAGLGAAGPTLIAVPVDYAAGGGMPGAQSLP